MRLPSFLRPKNKPPTSADENLEVKEEGDSSWANTEPNDSERASSAAAHESESRHRADDTVLSATDLGEISPGGEGDEQARLDHANKTSKWGSWRAKKQKDAVSEKITGAETAEVPKAKNLPIRVVIGYLPEVSERDAKEYALGLADKHFEQMSLVFFEALPFAQGFAYEIHEGGSGKTFLPELITYFESLGEFDSTAQNSVVIKTATRLVEVQRTREGLATVLLPESSEVEPTPWLRGTKNMTPAVSKNTAFAYTGFGLFASGMVALLLCGAVFRLQPFATEAAPKAKVVSVDELPRTQWDMIQNVPEDSYVSALRFKEGKWQAPELHKIGEEPTPPQPNPGATVPNGAAVIDRAN